MKQHNVTWHADVRSYEVDSQGIVNNAVYMNYLDNARVKYLHEKNIAWQVWHKQGVDIVLYQSQLHYHSALREGDSFYVTTSCTLEGRLKLIFNQSLSRTDNNSIVIKAKNTVVCIDRHQNKPCLPDTIYSHLFG